MYRSEKEKKKRRKNPQDEWWVRNTEWCLTQPGDLFNSMKIGSLLLSGGCPHVLCSSLHRSHIPVLHHNWQRILLGFPLILILSRGKGKHCAMCPAFSLTGFPRTLSCNSQSLFYNHQTSSHGHHEEWDNSLATAAGINGAGLVGDVLGDWQARYPFCTWTCLNNHFLITAKMGNLLKFVAGDTIRKYRINGGKRPLICLCNSFYPKLNHEDWCYWQKNSPLPSSWDASEQFDVNLHSPTSLEKKSFPTNPAWCNTWQPFRSGLWRSSHQYHQALKIYGIYPPLHVKPQTQIPETGRSR